MTTTTAKISARANQLAASIRGVPDFPKPGILFRDITPVLADPALLELAIDAHVDAVADLSPSITKILGIESRGFLFGMPLAARVGCGFVPVRKPGKLPAQTWSEAYDLEYGSAELHLHRDVLGAADRVLIVDDLLATGGTAAAATRLAARAGAAVLGCLFFVELEGLGGRDKLHDCRVDAILRL